jgi:hypothetical protein
MATPAGPVAAASQSIAAVAEAESPSSTEVSASTQEMTGL